MMAFLDGSLFLLILPSDHGMAWQTPKTCARDMELLQCAPHHRGHQFAIYACSCCRSIVCSLSYCSYVETRWLT